MQEPPCQLSALWSSEDDEAESASLFLLLVLGHDDLLDWTSFTEVMVDLVLPCAKVQVADVDCAGVIQLLLVLLLVNFSLFVEVSRLRCSCLENFTHFCC